MRWSALLSCFHQLVLRYAARHRLIGLFNILSIALGVAVYLAIQLANHSARSAFEASLDLVSGKSHLEVRAPDGQLDEMNFTKLHSHPLIAAVTPVVEGYAILADYPGEYLHLFGTDLFTNLSFQTINLNTSPDPDSDRDSGGEFEIERVLGQPDGITISPGFAREKGLRTGDTLTAVINGENRSLNIIAFNRPADKTREEAHRNLAVMDIGWAQELLGRSGRLTSLQIQLKDPRPLEASATAIRSLLPPNLLVQPPARRSLQVNRM
ncbi:MAG: ABC transporter permease, partial [Verrucomicrobiota bacterium]